MMENIDFNKCIEYKSIVAFKPKDNDEWYTGYITYKEKPNSEYNKEDYWKYSINIILPINPQWQDDSDKNIYYHNEIEKIKILEY